MCTRDGTRTQQQSSVVSTRYRPRFRAIPLTKWANVDTVIQGDHLRNQINDGLGYCPVVDSDEILRLRVDFEGLVEA